MSITAERETQNTQHTLPICIKIPLHGTLRWAHTFHISLVSGGEGYLLLGNASQTQGSDKRVCAIPNVTAVRHKPGLA